ncbi:MAG TPA: deoxyribodipyrimidine photo-lyase [Cytophagaceae bacterium]|jgi:deoxyribodipyrimidine photo-lyase
MNNSESGISLFWFRRDLRLFDNAGLYHALKSKYSVLPIFIFDTDILEKLEDKDDSRVQFIYDQLTTLHSELKKIDSSILIKIGKPLEVIKGLCNTFDIKSIFTNHDYEPYAKERDTSIAQYLNTENIEFLTYKDQVIFEKNEVVSDSGNPYRVYTPYKNKWRLKLTEFFLKSYPIKEFRENYLATPPYPIPSLAEIGFLRSQITFPSTNIDEKEIAIYDQVRDFPAKASTSKLSIHLRFGTVSIREIAKAASELNETWLNELIWREFFMQILYHFPLVQDSTFNTALNNFPWRHDESDFHKWCEGKTGYPLVDAGMREMNATGYMHNRVRLVTASFLTKHLLLDYKWGEAYFARKLLDFDLASNNGNWQWAAGTGADAQPFFRIFNPTLQQERFDKEFAYIKKWVPEYGTKTYPSPIVEHKFAVERAKKTFANFRR